jgi:hypothetical protein
MNGDIHVKTFKEYYKNVTDSWDVERKVFVSIDDQINNFLSNRNAVEYVDLKLNDESVILIYKKLR